VSDREWWNRVKQVLQGALERDAHEREAYLRHTCGGDPVLLSEVQSLLAAMSGPAVSPSCQPYQR
jgi:hypothetical protein